MNKKILDKFLECGYFIGIPSQKKIFCLIPKLNTANFECYPSFYLNDFYMSQEKSFFSSDEFYDISFSSFFDLLSNESAEKPEIIWDKVEKDYYFNRFSTLKNEIINQRLKKGVPFTFLRGNFLIERKHKVYFIKNLLQNSSESSYIYGFWYNNWGSIGATPELLFTQENNIIKTIALAGTMQYNKNFNKLDMIMDSKIRKEHFCVIEGLKDSLSNIADVLIENTQVLQVTSLVHLKTNITAKIFDDIKFNFIEILKKIHPTAAVGILPKNSVSKWLNYCKTESFNRGYYASPFGVLIDKNHSFCVCTIRGIQWNKNELKICAGGGVIEESSFDLEWQEIISKIDAIKKNLSI
jgi:menaquinone-specific isochorismate synthase